MHVKLHDLGMLDRNKSIRIDECVNFHTITKIFHLVKRLFSNNIKHINLWHQVCIGSARKR